MPDFDYRILLVNTYAAFNARAIDEVLTTMHPDVDWPNGWEGGRVIGHEAVRDYWTRQWAVLDPRVEPLRFETDPIGHIVVDVHQVVKDPSGSILSDGMVQHVYQFEDGLVRRMDIRHI
ncbi:ketosteroid isomerase [Spirosoma sp. HMF4905]|uniref:Ketosteroid isomerase n=1 Tax=Spirosoma arboris TaxID=2682092 RepID=A0A7K1SJU9_9BACT|nr:nuclear transport factor 2 family protein [Spirosoma arboris]MVM34091.1 ketosteroid isomerase [Spirosoma arboris]